MTRAEIGPVNPWEDQPKDGDVVITHDPESPQPFSIRQVPGDAQAWWERRNAAVDVGRRFARHHAVALWMSDGTVATRLLDYRSAGRAKNS